MATDQKTEMNARSSIMVLGIESSCDETAVAVVKHHRQSDDSWRTMILSNVIYSQVAIHSEWGGVVPEIASREHIRAISKLCAQAVEQADLSLHHLDGIAVTQGPGLMGTLLVGLQFAKGLAQGLDIPWLGVNHLEGHLCAAMLDEHPPSYPHLALLVSGGHTQLIDVQNFGAYEVIGSTRDDAAGEAFDKVAKVLGLGYPGGVQIDKLSQRGNPERFELPRGMKQKSSAEFSFSGLKTHAMKLVKELSPMDEQTQFDLCASVQESIAAVLVQKSVYQAKQRSLPGIVLGGGVAANSRVRALMQEQCDKNGLWCYVPPKKLCTDNAAMIAAAGARRLVAGQVSEALETAHSRWSPNKLMPPSAPV